MKSKNVVIIGLILIILTVSGCFYYYKIDKNLPTFAETKKVKEEYEALNGTVRESDGATYQKIKVDATIEIDSLTATEASKFIKEESGILFIGAPWCPWCRNALPVLMDVARDNNLVIKYLDLTDVRNVYEIKDKKLVKTQKEGDGYNELLDALDEVLGDKTYTLKDEEGKVYDTKEKRIYIPTTIAVKNGNIEGTHVSTVELNENQTKYDALEQNQIIELKNIYQDLINKTKGLNVCSSESVCD
ncbi:MAG: hypothetical protein OSJ65_01870 [Bacilli bacterium]|nr:hypothetical protein [Bacilli bacterium]